MKVIDAYWEKRNLGLRVCEIAFKEDDFFDVNTISNIEKLYDYLVAKIPEESVPLVHELENFGFRYLENQQVIYFLSEELLSIDKAWVDRFQNIKCAIVTDKIVLESICDHIKKGLYTKGRISADPEIEDGISDLRIVNWLKDIFEMGNALVYRLIKEENAIGYFVLEKMNNNHINIVQAGIFRGYQDKGLSFLLLYYILKTAFDFGFKGIFASISTGNRKTLNSISKFVHLTVKQTYIVMRKKVTGNLITSKKIID